MQAVIGMLMPHGTDYCSLNTVCYQLTTKMKNIIIIYILLLSGCCYHIKPPANVGKLKTATVDYIENKATQVAPTLSNVLTEKLKNKIANETSLKIVNEKGDLHFTGKITDYKVTNAALTGGNDQQVAQNRLTITMQMKCDNATDSKLNFDQTFTQFADFTANQSLSAVEAKLIADITDLLAQEIFNKALVSW
ncbi:MAG: LptE family protein [Bacteroidota bacterium]|nr:LptE family protein [Bacteroidota bacterium]